MGLRFVTFVLTALMANVAINGVALALHGGSVDDAYRGFKLMTVAPKPGMTFDTKIIEAPRALGKIRKALDIIRARSPFSAQIIETLKESGTIVIVYAPGFRELSDSGALIAGAYLPDFFKREGIGLAEREFVMVIGRHGIKWPTHELAEVIVHELAGHARQHLRGKLKTVRELDLECEAMLYSEKFYQDYGVNKKSHDIIKFRQALEDYWCSDFKRYLRKTSPAAMKLWDVLNPNIPGLLAIFDGYIRRIGPKKVVGSGAKKAREIRPPGTRQ